MQVKILGSAAGGGFPQWNCACPNCHALRRGQFQGKARSQTQVAISGDGVTWFLLGASPDLRSQIESTPELHPHECGSDTPVRPCESGAPARQRTRSSPIQGVILASADLDHVLGLLLLRELQPFEVWAADSVIDILCHHNSMFAMLNRVPDQVRWNPIPVGRTLLSDSVGRTLLSDSVGRALLPDSVSRTLLSDTALNHDAICFEAIPVSTRLPAYANRAEANDAVLGLILTGPSGAKLGFFPQLASLTPELKDIFSTLDCLLLDGTFWSDDELIRLQGSGQSARDMGHIPVGGPGGTLQQLAGLNKPRKMYIHINNTNPMLNEAGPEYRAVRDAGWELAEDGCQFTL